MWTISFASGPRALTSFESGAGLCLAESEIEIPSFNKLLGSYVHRLHWWPHPPLQNFEVGGSRLHQISESHVQNGRLPQRVYKRQGKSGARLWGGELGQLETAAWTRCRIFKTDWRTCRLHLVSPLDH